jgi:coproporphyrinogen III oxidase-like Fe-S oxidoreductase
VGPAAVSTLPGANGEILRLENPRDAERFFKEDPEHYLAIEKIDAKTFLLEQLLMGLRLSEGIERTEIVGRFTKPLEALVPGLWEDWLRQGLARNSRTHYACTPGGRNILNRLLKQAAEAIENIGQLAVRWP